MKENLHAVVFNQDKKSFNIETTEMFILNRYRLFKAGNYYVYTDLFVGSEDDCIKFCQTHKLKLS